MLQQSLRRSAHTCDQGIAISAIKQASDALSKLLLPQLQSQLKQSISSKLAGAALAGAQAIASDSAAMAGASLVGKASLVAVGLQPLSATSGNRHGGQLRTLNALLLCVQYTPQLRRQAGEDLAAGLSHSALEAVRDQIESASCVLAAFEVTRRTPPT